MKKIMKNILFVFCVLCFSLSTACSEKKVMLSESSHTLYLWEEAVRCRYEERYELALEYMGLALSSATSSGAIRQISREIADVERMIKTRR